MSQFRLARLGLLLAAIGLNAAPAMLGIGSAAYAEALRPAVGTPLQEAQKLMKAGKNREALAKVQEADNVSGKTPAESLTIERMRASAASAAGDQATAIKSFETLITTGHLPAAEQLRYVQALAGMYYQRREYPKAVTWINRYLSEGGDDPKMRELLIQTYYLNGEYARVAKEVKADVQAAEKAGRTPSEENLQLLATCSLRSNDKATYASAMEKLVVYHPKKEYWGDLLNRVQSKPGFSGRLTLDVYRLKLATGQMKTASEYMEMAQLALQAGVPTEAKKVVEQGMKAGVLGTGADAERHKRLLDLATKTIADDAKTMAQNEAEASKAKDGTALVGLGYTYVSIGQADKGLALMEQGLAKGTKHDDDAKLHLGIAYMLAEKKSKAVQMLKTVQGTDGNADLARYWVVQINHPIA